nr:MAG: maturation protein [ssRNA phage SRR6960799_10]
MTVSLGPRNRNFDIYLKAERRLISLRNYVPTGTVQVVDAEHRGAQLRVNNPWRQQKPATLDPTARTLNYWKRVYPYLDYTTAVGSGGYHTRSVGPWPDALNSEWNARYLSPIYGQWDEQLRTEAILDALSKVKDQKWNAGVALAESEGVAQMAVDCMQLIAKTRTALRKGDFGKAYSDFRRKTNYMSYPAWKRKYWNDIRHVQSVRRSQDIPKGWLYYHFGIAPTIADISDAAEAHQTNLADLLYQSAPFVVGYAKQTYRTSTMRSFAKVDYSFLRSVRVKIRLTPKNTMVGKLSELGLTNPPEALYNRVPFSWVVDYFSTFGDWLGALDTSLGWNFADKWEECWRVNATSLIIPVNGYSGVKIAYPSEKGIIRHKNITRNVRGDLYGPMGSILPTWKRRGPSAGQISNLLSVLATSMRATVRP